MHHLHSAPQTCRHGYCVSQCYGNVYSIFSNDLSAACACTLGQQPHVASTQQDRIVYVVLKAA